MATSLSWTGQKTSLKQSRHWLLENLKIGIYHNSLIIETLSCKFLINSYLAVTGMNFVLINNFAIASDSFNDSDEWDHLNDPRDDVMDWKWILNELRNCTLNFIGVSSLICLIRVYVGLHFFTSPTFWKTGFLFPCAFCVFCLF